MNAVAVRQAYFFLLYADLFWLFGLAKPLRRK
jgi:hypothetical protein